MLDGVASENGDLSERIGFDVIGDCTMASFENNGTQIALITGAGPGPG